MLLRCQGCQTSFLIEDATVPEAGVRVRCSRCQNEFQATRPGGPPPADWPSLTSTRMTFGMAEPRVPVEFVCCPGCATRLAVVPQQAVPHVRCEDCELEFVAEPEVPGRHVLELAGTTARSLYGHLRGWGPTSRALRQRPTRAWLERDLGTPARWVIFPLTGDAATAPDDGQPGGGVALQRRAGGWHLAPSNEPRMVGTLASGTAAEPLGRCWFGQSGAIEPSTHHAPLDEHPADPSVWRVWADLLLEQADPLGAWLMKARRSTEQLHDQLGLLGPLVRRRLATVTWNDFGFVESLSLEAERLATHLFVTHAADAPAVRHLVTLMLELPRPDSAAVALSALARARLPRSLRRIVFVGPSSEVRGAAGVLDAVRDDCPWLETTPATLWQR